MLKKKQEEIINKCIVLFKESVQSNINAQDLFLPEFSKIPSYTRLKKKLEETEVISKKVSSSVINKSLPSFTPRERVLFISILRTVNRQLESMSLISPAGSIEQENILYNQKIFEIRKEIDDLLLNLKQLKVL